LAIICFTTFNCLGSSTVAVVVAAAVETALNVDRAISDAKWNFMTAMSYVFMCRNLRNYATGREKGRNE